MEGQMVKGLSIEDIPGLTLLYDEPASRHTTLQVGGPMDILVIPKSKQALVKLVRRLMEVGVKPLVIGAGTNLLVRDGGIRGVVVKVGEELGGVTWGSEGVTVGAGERLIDLSRQAVERGMSGLEYACGIPGTVGGALYMNAGAYGWSMADVVSEVELLSYNGRVQRVDPRMLKFGYRLSVLGDKGIALSCRMSLLAGDSKLLKRLVDEVLAVRREKMPLDYPSAGSFFKNPSKELPAGRLLEEAGCKGMRVGKAQISEKHANFIVNTGGASSADILNLMELAQEKVRRLFGIKLEPEVCIVGEEEVKDGK